MSRNVARLVDNRIQKHSDEWRDINNTRRGFSQWRNNVRAVSYTHLDVYKRQQLLRLGVSHFQLPLKKGVILIQLYSFLSKFSLNVIRKCYLHCQTNRLCTNTSTDLVKFRE